MTKPLDFPVVIARIETQLLLKRSVAETIRLKQDLAERNQALVESNARLSRINRRMEHDLRTAARIQAALLPRRIPTFPTARFAWHFEPCDELAGDSLNVVAIDDRRVGLYVLDVSGHGVASALLSVTLSRMLSSPLDPSSVLVRPVDDLDGDGSCGLPLPPGQVADELSRRFPFDLATGQYFTIIYGLFDVITGEFQYVTAGHPGLAYVPATGPPRIIDVPGFPIGLAAELYESRSIRLEPGDRLYLYSDGITEAMSPADVLYGAERMLNRLFQGRSEPLANSVNRLLADVRAWCGNSLHDDISLVAVEFGPTVAAGAETARSVPRDGTACDDPRPTARTAVRPSNSDLGTKADGRLRDHPGDPPGQRPDRRRLHPQPRLRWPLGPPQPLRPLRDR